MPQKHDSEGSGPQWKIAQTDGKGIHAVLGGGDALAGHSLISQTADKESKGAKKTEGMPVGISSFRKLRDNDMYYVDKSMFIDQILKSGAEVTLITRPRRFGKSLNLDMTDCYLNIRYADEPDRFKGLRISEERPNDPEKNSNYVIDLNFKELRIKTYEIFKTSFRNTVIGLFAEFPELKGSEKLSDDLRRWHSALTEGTADYDTLTKSIKYLCEMIEAHHGKKPIILIDEYDNPMNNAFGKGELHEQIVGFLREVLSSALKDNDSLRFAVLTGVMKISQESIFSGLNNPEVVDVFSTQYDEMFGFTQDEVEWLLRSNSYENKFAEAKRWYDGYRFGDEDVYNPWSIINYIKNGCKPKAYWAGTSGNDIIGDLINKADQSTWDDLTGLCGGKAIEADIQTNIAYCDLESAEDTIYSVMVAAGYLKAIPDMEERDEEDVDEGDEEDGDAVTYRVSIPNKEMFKVFSETILRRFGTGVNTSLNNLIKALKAGKAEEVQKNLRKLMEIVSVRILKDEFPYEAFIAGLMAKTSGQYEVLADHEAGDGYFDIRMKRVSGRGPNLIIEVKRRNENNKHLTMDELAQSALKQIHEKRYCYGLEGRTILYGIAFESKNPMIVTETVEGDPLRSSPEPASVRFRAGRRSFRPPPSRSHQPGHIVRVPARDDAEPRV